MKIDKDKADHWAETVWSQPILTECPNCTHIFKLAKAEFALTISKTLDEKEDL